MVVISNEKVTQYPYEEANKSVVEWAVDENIVETAVATELRTVYEQSAHFEASQDLVRNALKTVEDMYQYGTLSLDDYDEIMNVLQDAEI